MTAPAPQSQPMTDRQRQHIADYLAERKPDVDGDIAVVFTGAQRDAFVALLNSHAPLKARVEELTSTLRLARAFISPEADPPRITNRAMVLMIDAALPPIPGEVG